MFSVEYACDENNNHQAPMAECTDSNTKEFATEEEMVEFIAQATYIYNLPELLGNPAQKMANPILDCLEESCI
jgi:hypothetical protein